MKKGKLTSNIEGVYLYEMDVHDDSRGWLMELFRVDCMFDENHPKMGYVSQTKPGVTRGPHEHVTQTDYFCFTGPGDFELHLWERQETDSGCPYVLHEVFQVGESNPTIVMVPPGVVHAYKNISAYPGIVMNFPNVLYAGPGKLYPVDEIRHEDSASSSLFQF